MNNLFGGIKQRWPNNAVTPGLKFVYKASKVVNSAKEFLFFGALIAIDKLMCPTPTAKLYEMNKLSLLTGIFCHLPVYHQTFNDAAKATTPITEK
jgi:hypothetical protein